MTMRMFYVNWMLQNMALAKSPVTHNLCSQSVLRELVFKEFFEAPLFPAVLPLQNVPKPTT